jgi:hypothetical protein
MLYIFCFSQEGEPVVVAQHILEKYKTQKPSLPADATLLTPQLAYEQIPLPETIEILIDTLVNQMRKLNKDFDNTLSELADSDIYNDKMKEIFGILDGIVMHITGHRISSNFKFNILSYQFYSLFIDILALQIDKLKAAIRKYDASPSTEEIKEVKTSALQLIKTLHAICHIIFKIASLETEDYKEKTPVEKSQTTIANLLLNKADIHGYKDQPQAVYDLISLQHVIKNLIDLTKSQTQKLKSVIDEIRRKINSMVSIDTEIKNRLEKIFEITKILVEITNKVENIPDDIEEKLDEIKPELVGIKTKTISPKDSSIVITTTKHGTLDAILDKYISDTEAAITELKAAETSEHKIQHYEYLDISSHEKIAINRIKTLKPLFKLTKCLYILAEIAQKSMLTDELALASHNISLVPYEFDRCISYCGAIKRKLTEKSQELTKNVKIQNIRENWIAFNIQNPILQIIRILVNPPARRWGQFVPADEESAANVVINSIRNQIKTKLPGKAQILLRKKIIVRKTKTTKKIKP